MNLPFLNADYLTKEMESAGSKSPLIAAVRVFFERLYQYLADETSFIVETTLSGSYINKFSAS